MKAIRHIPAPHPRWRETPACVPALLACLIGLAFNAVAARPEPVEGAPLVQWRKVARLPDPIGFAGAFAGVSGDALLVAGGANFPDRKPWEGGRKEWHDSVFVLEQPDGTWRGAGRLPSPLGYGVAVSHPRGLVCIGGSDAREHHAAAFILRWSQGRLEITTLPPLPRPCANLSGALLGDVVWVAGGIAMPDATNALASVFSMDLSAAPPVWKQHEPIPGRGRMLAAAGAFQGAFYLFGGTALSSGPDGKPVRDWLREAWRFTPGQGWKRLADLPRAAVAAPSPMPTLDTRLLVLGGDDGAQVNTAPTAHNGFRHDVLAYDSKTDRWEPFGQLPFALVTTCAITWRDRWIVPGGESKPGVRSTDVWMGNLRVR